MNKKYYSEFIKEFSKSLIKNKNYMSTILFQKLKDDSVSFSFEYDDKISIAIIVKKDR